MCSRSIKVSVVMFLIFVPLFTALPRNHNMAKRSSFFDLECKGIYNKTMFYRLDKICEDCYNLFRETSIHRLCKHKCFTHQTFEGCMNALLTPEEEVTQLQHFIKVVNGAPLSFDFASLLEYN